MHQQPLLAPPLPNKSSRAGQRSDVSGRIESFTGINFPEPYQLFEACEPRRRRRCPICSRAFALMKRCAPITRSRSASAGCLTSGRGHTGSSRNVPSGNTWPDRPRSAHPSTKSIITTSVCSARNLRGDAGEHLPRTFSARAAPGGGDLDVRKGQADRFDGLEVVPWCHRAAEQPGVRSALDLNTGSWFRSGCPGSVPGFWFGVRGSLVRFSVAIIQMAAEPSNRHAL